MGSVTKKDTIPFLREESAGSFNYYTLPSIAWPLIPRQSEPEEESDEDLPSAHDWKWPEIPQLSDDDYDQDDYNEDDDPRHDWRRADLAAFLPYIDKESSTHGKTRRSELNPSRIDCTRIGEWLKLCDENHGPHCGSHLLRPGHARTMPRWLIDVDQLCLVAIAAECKYFTLSYVWGRVGSFQTTVANLNELQQPNSLQDFEKKLPKTITMADIYRNSYATIIAAQGSDVNGGLRGINTATWARPHKPTKHPLEMSDKETMAAMARNLMKTKWYSRGWTFQEQLFSVRKIYFHDDTVNWECHCASFYEAQDIISPQLRGLCHKTSEQVQAAFIDSATWPDFHRYARLVAIFNQCDLSREEDVLNAFEGVLSSLSHIFKGSFVSGLPSLFFDAALLWQPYVPLSRRKPSSVDVEACLPSWSWIGWHGNLNSESWRSGNDYLRRINARDKDSYGPSSEVRSSPPPSWHTISTIQWSYSETLSGKRTPISSSWKRDIDKFTRDESLELPAEWTRPHSENDGVVYFKHESDPEQEFMYPIPLRLPEDTYQAPIRAAFLHCNTRRTHLQFGYSRPNVSTSHCLYVDLVDDQEHWVGILRLNKAIPVYAETEYHYAESCELIELSSGSVQNQQIEEVSFDEWDLPDCPRHGGLYEFYNVMWIEWGEGVAYRKAVGRVEKRAWEKCRLEEVDVTLG
ncbi:hypothetical protein IQ07DRAFT_521481 [Pyrenochaeta sp. DS3sAY3a]|nr:hypothetical protein IQ07DRAFT_521481 [Pyrenochaeta sp. DS3sAY3a]